MCRCFQPNVELYHYECAGGGEVIGGASRGDGIEGSQNADTQPSVSREIHGGSQPATDTTERRESGGLASTSGKGEAASVSGQGEGVQGGVAAKGLQGNDALETAAAAAQDHISTTEEAQRRCDLFCALCTKKPELLHQLLLVYGKVRDLPDCIFSWSCFAASTPQGLRKHTSIRLQVKA